METTVVRQHTDYWLTERSGVRGELHLLTSILTDSSREQDTQKAVPNFNLYSDGLGARRLLFDSHQG
jgi:hypothetical protein